MIPEKQGSGMGMRLMMKNSGELSIRKFADNLRSTIMDENTLLILFEAIGVRNMLFGDHVHLMSNWSFIKTLENFGIVSSADELFDEMEKTERIPPRQPSEWELRSKGKGSKDELYSFDRIDLSWV